jgi:antibiotic biosynthesis monooxygenase (ABM) superfamily enzyme
VVDTKSGSVKVVWVWRPRDGVRERFAAWLEQIVADASRAAGFEGSSVFVVRDEHLLLLRFADRDAFARWEQSAVVAAMFAASAELAASTEPPQHRTGLETWFALPGQPPSTVPPRWKMALVTWLALLPQVVVLAFVVPPLPFLLGVAVSTAIPVAMLTWVVMPRLTRLLQGWLYPAPGSLVPPPRSGAMTP